jgi:pantoate--beta-alanine ligase
MYLFKKAAHLRAHLDLARTQGGTVGFVPTMGALHQGHLSLLRQSLEQSSCTVCSIFVNPTQFNQAADLEKYPRTPAKDLAMLAEVGCDVVFMPAVSEIYPRGQHEDAGLNLGGLDQGMEGRFRPGHFQGVAQVVKRLLDIVVPQHLFMGQKDYQQFVIVRHILQMQNLPVQLHMCPTLREANGLAMSSRNVRLSPQQRAQASIIYESLQQAAAGMTAGRSPAEVQALAWQQLHIPGFKPEYFEVVDADKLQPVARFDAAERIVACTAVWAGGVRLIDNLILKG